MQRLSVQTLDRVRGVTPTGRVRGNGTGRPATIVHIGVGAFARAHLGVYVEDLVAAGATGTIRGVSLRTSRAESQMAPQDCLYSVTTREPGREPETRIIGAFSSVRTGPTAAIDAISDPDVTMVTLTVTEKAYVHEPVGPDGGPSLPSVLVDGLAARHERGGGPLVIASLDNVLDNGRVLRDLVRSVAGNGGTAGAPGLVAWIDRAVGFPRSVVDRLVPATTPADLDEIAQRIGVRDEAAVVAEQHRSWIIESVEGLPALDAAGVEIVDDTGPHERRKLHLLNAPHSALAYCGPLAGHVTIADAVRDQRIRRFVEALVAEVLEVAPLLGLGEDLEPRRFAESALRRFANDALGHTCAQVAMDGSRKLAQRLLPVMDLRADHRLDTATSALVVASWLAGISGIPITGRTLDRPVDPAGDRVTAALDGRIDEEHVAAALRTAFGDSAVRHASVVTDALRRVTTTGVEALGVRP